MYLLSGLATLANGTLRSRESLESRGTSRSRLSSLTSRTLGDIVATFSYV